MMRGRVQATMHIATPAASQHRRGGTEGPCCRRSALAAAAPQMAQALGQARPSRKGGHTVKLSLASARFRGVRRWSAGMGDFRNATTQGWGARWYLGRRPDTW